MAAAVPTLGGSQRQQVRSVSHTAAVARAAAPSSGTTPELLAYHIVADRTLDQLMELLDELGDSTDLPGYDATFSNGVVTLRLGVHGTYVINKQPPNRQIWLSSPLSGPRRFEYRPATKAWHATSDGSRLDELLSSELTKLVGEPVQMRFDLDG